MHEHRARIDELLDLESLERAKQVTRAFHIDGLIERVVLTGLIEIGDEMNDARELGTELLTNAAQCELD